MHYKIKINILFTVFFISGNFSSAQNFDETLKSADSAFNFYDFKKAEKLYNRLIFFNLDTIVEYNLYFKKAESLLLQNKYIEAAVCCDSAIFFNKNNADEAVLKKCEIYILKDNYAAAEKILISYNFADNEKSVSKKNELLGIIYFQEENFLLSEKHFIACIPDDKLYKKEQIVFTFSEIENEKFLNKKTAQVLSIFFPGTGLMYDGNFFQGFNSLVFLSVIVYAGCDFAVKISPIDATISILPWFLRYYKSGIKKAENGAVSKNAGKKTEYLLKILKIINH